jgi:hypothetical protein
MWMAGPSTWGTGRGPCPPPGPLAFSCAWPGRGIPSSRMEIEGAAIRAAADTAVTLWLDDPWIPGLAQGLAGCLRSQSAATAAGSAPSSWTRWFMPMRSRVVSWPVTASSSRTSAGP